MNDSLNIIQANKLQATNACQKIILRKSSPNKTQCFVEILRSQKIFNGAL